MCGFYSSWCWKFVQWWCIYCAATIKPVYWEGFLLSKRRWTWPCFASGHQLHWLGSVAGLLEDIWKCLWMLLSTVSEWMQVITSGIPHGPYGVGRKICIGCSSPKSRPEIPWCYSFHHISAFCFNPTSQPSLSLGKGFQPPTSSDRGPRMNISLKLVIEQTFP